MKRSFKENDWCYYNYKLSQILKIEDGNITGVTDGYFTSGGNNTDNCYPLTIDIKLISEEVNTIYNMIHNLNFKSLNFPEIHYKLVQMWKYMCDNYNDNELIGKMYIELKDFYNKINDSVKSLREYKVLDINIYR